MKEISKISYLGLAELLKEKFSKIPPGSALPSYRAVAKEFGVSLSVCQRAMRLLQENEIVATVQGRVSRIRNLDALKKDFVFYGVIHPYNPSGNFAPNLNARIEEAFSNLKQPSFPIIASSRRSNETEERLGEQMLANHMRGILLSPVTNSRNTEFFHKISRKIPVVLFDQELHESFLPLIKFNYKKLGFELGKALHREKRKKILVVQHVVPNQSLCELSDALKNEIEIQFFQRDFFGIFGRANRINEVQNLFKVRDELKQTIAGSGCDAVFCPYDDIMNELIVNGMPSELLDQVRLATIRGTGDMGLRYLQREIWEWEMSYSELFRTAVHCLIQWNRNHHAPVGIKKIAITRRK